MSLPRVSHPTPWSSHEFVSVKKEGDNALRGSGPDQKHAFEDAMAHVGCPDRRIDRRCITWCRPPNRYVTPDVRCNLVASSRESGGFIVTFVPGHHGPSHPGEFIGECDSGNLGGAPGQQSSEPGPMVRAIGILA